MKADVCTGLEWFRHHYNMRGRGEIVRELLRNWFFSTWDLRFLQSPQFQITLYPKSEQVPIDIIVIINLGYNIGG